MSVWGGKEKIMGQALIEFMAQETIEREIIGEKKMKKVKSK